MGKQVDHKTLLFNNWINSDLIYVNDILDENGEISHNFILNRVNNKSNWIHHHEKSNSKRMGRYN
jgi:hypothetical protein